MTYTGTKVTQNNRMVFAFFMVAIFVSVFSTIAPGATYRQAIKKKCNENTPANCPANALDLKFKQTLAGKPKLWHLGMDTGDLGSGNGRIDDNEQVESGVGRKTGQGRNTMTLFIWPQASFAEMTTEAEAQIDYKSILQTQGVLENGSVWTKDNQPVGTVELAGEPAVLSFLQIESNPREAFAEFQNREEFALIYTDIELYKNNSLDSFDTVDFTVPTGELVAGVPASLTLQPGESQILSFGIVEKSTYQLALANVANLNDPDNVFGVATAEVPEPCSLSLLCIAVLLFRRHRRKERAWVRTPDTPPCFCRCRACPMVITTFSRGLKLHCPAM